MPSPWVPAGGGGGLVDSVSGTLPITAVGAINSVVAINPATDATAGSLSAADKTKLDGLASCVANLTRDIGLYSCAENDRTLARGSASHAEGRLTEANAENAHSEGNLCISAAYAAHAEGDTTIASSEGAHSEGTGTRAGSTIRNFTIAAGGITVTILGDVHLEFVNGDRVTVWSTTPGGLQSQVRVIGTIPAFGGVNTTFDLTLPIDLVTTAGQIVDAQQWAQAHAEGLNTIASGQGSHAEGNTTIASGLGAHAEGQGTLASGQLSHAEGLNTTASGVNGAHAEGTGTLASASGAHAEGNNCHAIGNDAHAEGDTTIASGIRCHAEGVLTTASADSAHAEGFGCTASFTAAHAEGHNCIASAIYAHAEGDTCQATALRSHAEGVLSVASGDGAHAEGNTTAASGAASHAEGQATVASGVNSHAQGWQSAATRGAEHAEASGMFAVVGDAQYRRCTIKGATPGLAPAEAVALGPDGTATNFLALSKSYNVTVRVIATLMGVGAAARQTGAFFLNFVASRRSGGIIDISAVTPVVPLTTQGAAFVGATLVPTDGTGGNLALTFTNGALLTNNARIVGTVEYVEVLGT